MGSGDIGGQDLSRRSSLKSSVMEFGVSRAGSPGPTHTENPLGTLARRDSTEQKKPEVVVTKAKRKIPSPSPSPRDDVSGSRATAFMNLLPAPTPTRFIGMMHKVKQDIDKKKPEAGGSRSKPSSRRSSIVPTTKTIDEDNEVESNASTPRKQEAGGGVSSSGFPTALRMVGKTKMDLANKMKGLAGSARKDSVKSDAASTTSTSPSNAGTPLKSKGGASPVSPSPSKRGGGSGAKKAASGLAAFKKGSGFGKKKKEVSTDEAEGVGSKEMKLRLFFKERNEQTDEEVLANIGREVVPKELGQGLNEIVNAAAMMKKLMKEKEQQASAPSVGVVKTAKDDSTSLTYTGTLKNRLSSSRSTSRVGGTNNNVVDIAQHATHFLGKIMARKDRHGLYVGSPQSSLEKEQGKPLDNPVITALEKVRLRPQGSTESAESRASRASAAGSPAGSGAPGGAAAEEAVVGDKIITNYIEAIFSYRKVSPRGRRSERPSSRTCSRSTSDHRGMEPPQTCAGRSGTSANFHSILNSCDGL